jgi:hypothetical protein
MAEWLAIFFIKFKLKGGCQFSDVTAHHWAFFFRDASRQRNNAIFNESIDPRRTET